MKVGQFSESDAVGALRMSVYSSRHASESHRQGNQFDLGNTRIKGWDSRTSGQEC